VKRKDWSVAVLARWAAAIVFLWLSLVPVAAQAQDVYARPNPELEAAMDVPLVPEHWTTVYGSFLRFHGEPTDLKLMMALSEHASERLPELATQLRVPIGDTIHVYVASSDHEFHTLQPGRAPSWADGVAYPALGVIYLHSPRARSGTGKPLTAVLDHELVHIILGRAFYPNPTPQWLQEGVAQVWAGEFTPDTTRRLADGMLGGGLLSLSSLDKGFPDDAVRAQLAYAQSADLVSWLEGTYGPETISGLVAQLVAGQGMEGAVYQVTGDYLDDVEAAWKDRLEGDIPLSITALTGENTWWVIGALILAVAGFMRRREFHRRIQKMGEEEALVDELLARMRAEEQEHRVQEEWQVLTGGKGPH
jgi:hypothetical protein